MTRLPANIFGTRMTKQDTVERVLVLGASGMLGNAVFRLFAESPATAVFGSTRSRALHHRFPENLRPSLISNVDVENDDALITLFADVNPDVVINCVGLVKQLAEANDSLAALPINAILPHRLARLCRVAGARLVHVSTDCVFDGADGDYSESDRPNADDLYGRSKLLGEVDYENAVTLRTSIIGCELGSAHGLVDWFLAQEGSIKGFTRAIFSGLPTIELARVIRDFVLPRPELRGLYHVSAEPISKYDLLGIVAEVYGKDIEILPDGKLAIDRSLNSARFRHETGYRPPDWRELVRAMRDFG
ncbi:dTDP-4-dehydrorhamnose reductase family protein [Aurantimonas sp. A3-2-R12]|uniref:dTDP-4-dehydrorhamnose reductase family protein n=1 Tax=Aurantimonas sp. A3-2-R12 TaxID=3114362 RepID=UPI002E196771|nr:SDR family oxidoreductase [Aurantimonas sp. A3-2-R12]